MVSPRQSGLLNLSVDWAELAAMSGFLEVYTANLDTVAFKRPLVTATYNAMTNEFDQWMSVHARSHKANFTHVYEYSIYGDPYRHVGDTKYKLWKHVRRPAGSGDISATFMFMPAKHRVPTPYQRRNSSVGDDPIRRIPEEDFELYLSKTKKRRYIFLWKAPMNEYAIRRRISPIEAKYLFVPADGFHSNTANKPGGGRNWRFAGSYTITQDPPGSSYGQFTKAWTLFWGREMSPHKFDKIVGDQAAKVIGEGFATGANIAKKFRKVDVSVMTVTDPNVAIKQGRADALKAINATNEKLKAMTEGGRGWHWNMNSEGGVLGT